eukprot:1183393-Prorocentrum_minimum.AAC.4
MHLLAGCRALGTGELDLAEEELELYMTGTCITLTLPISRTISGNLSALVSERGEPVAITRNQSPFSALTGRSQ